MRWRSAIAAAVAPLASGCASTPADTVHHVVPHNVFGCPVDEGSELDRAGSGATVTLSALGDFGDSPDTTEVFAGATSEGRSLPFPEPLRGVEATIQSANGKWKGVGFSDPQGDVTFTMWSAAAACDASDWGLLPNAGGGQAMTAFAGKTKVLVAGGEVPNGPTPRPALADAAVLDLRTGEVTRIANGMHAPRAWATATPFGGDSVLVAGGNDGNRTTWGDAEVLTGDAFDRQVIYTLATPRTKHAAIVDALGRTLLIGGMDDRGVALDRIEAIAPGFGNVVSGLPLLARARVEPTVLRLADGSILVAGGVDDAGSPVGELEWLAPDASQMSSIPCEDDAWAASASRPPPKAGRVFVPLAGGGALAADPSDCCGASGVCPSGAGSLWWITADHCVYGPYPVSSPLCNARLVEGADGLPWIAHAEGWNRFDPWTWPPSIETPEVAPTDVLNPELPAPIAVDAGLFLWSVRDSALGSKLRGFRHDTRNVYTRDVLLLVDGPEHFVPTGPLSFIGTASFRNDGLHLRGRGVVLADTAYADVTIKGAAPAGVLPRLRLSGAETLEIGSGACPWPVQGRAFSVTRRGRDVTLDVDGAGAGPCTGPAGPVSIGLDPAIDETGAVQETVVGHLVVARAP